VPIVPSRAGRIQELLARLASSSAPERDSAVAGLRLVGPRVIEPLRAFLEDAGPSARLAALDVLETLDDRRALPLVLALARAANEAVATRALEVAAGRPDPRAVRPLAALMKEGGSAGRRHTAALALVRLQTAGVVEALDPLVAAVLDEAAEPSLRLVALNALTALDPPLAPATLRPLLERLAASATPAVAARASGLRRAARRR
jgi:HEAT repeat protein